MGNEPTVVDAPVREMPALELALLRQGVNDRTAGRERCENCHRTPLMGERVYVYDDGSLLCELCRAQDPEPPLYSRMVHGPEFGHTMKIVDQRGAG